MRESNQRSAKNTTVGEPVVLLVDQAEQLVSTVDQSTVFLLVVRLARDGSGLNDLAVVRDDCGVNRIGFGVDADSFSEVPCSARIDRSRSDSELPQLMQKHLLVTASRLHDDDRPSSLAFERLANRLPLNRKEFGLAPANYRVRTFSLTWSRIDRVFTDSFTLNFVAVHHDLAIAR
jgi:hypothetical protein